MLEVSYPSKSTRKHLRRLCFVITIEIMQKHFGNCPMTARLTSTDALTMPREIDDLLFKKPAYLLQSIYGILYLQLCVATQFASHVSVNTPAHSYSHGVGDPVAVLQRYPMRRSRRPNQPHPGYPRHKPSVPFQVEEVQAHRGQANVFNNRWHNNAIAQPIPLLPPSPYKVDSPDPESLWPLGLFIPPITPLHYIGWKRSDSSNTFDADKEDPYLLQGSEAIAAYRRSSRQGPYFHEIPHIKSLLANQDLRAKNNLKPNRIASIRKSWPYNRP